MLKRTLLLLMTAATISGNAYAQEPAKRVLLDTHFNHEVDKNTGKVQHYTWDDTSKWGGYSQFGELWTRNGATLHMLNEAPTAATLQGNDVYIIVDPDHVKDNPNPNYMDEASATAICDWVRKGGNLLVLANDQANCDLHYINILMDNFGLHFKDTTILQLEIPTKEKPENVYPLQGEIPGADKMYMRGTCSIELSKHARPLCSTPDKDVVIGEAFYGDGRVIAIADPWIYNEYIYHTLLPDNYDNASAAEWIVKRLLGIIEYPDVHDPVMAVGEDGRYYIFSTGLGIGVMSSADLKTWRMEKGVFKASFRGEPNPDDPRPAVPQWAKDAVPGFTGHMWAPDISKHGDKWYLYYSCSTFGRNGSVIGLATNKTLDPKSPDYKWEDQGLVVASYQHKTNWNAIDPNLCVTPEGKPWLVWGSFWDGLQIAPLKKDLKTLDAKPRTIARRMLTDGKEHMSIENGNDTIWAGENAIEGPFIYQHDGWYYLFVSHDYCCRGAKSTYKTVYGRSRKVNGPYVDKNGKNMDQGGGELLVGPTERYFGRGHNSAYDMPDGRSLFVCHVYDSQYGAKAKLFIKEMVFKDGWIELKD